MEPESSVLSFVTMSASASGSGLPELRIRALLTPASRTGGYSARSLRTDPSFDGSSVPGPSGNHRRARVPGTIGP